MCVGGDTVSVIVVCVCVLTCISMCVTFVWRVCMWGCECVCLNVGFGVC